MRTTRPPRARKTGDSGPGKPWTLRRVLRWVVVVCLAYLLAVVAVFGLSLNHVPALPPDSTVSSSGTNFLLVGSDSRAGLTEEQRKKLNTGDIEGQRTDTIMLLHVPWVGTPTLVSIPRDSWVPIPGHDPNKINAAFSIGGPELLVRTVEQSTGLHIDHYVEIGFAGIANTTDALGGVRLCPTQNYRDKMSGLKIKKGCQMVGGKKALAYVRMRYADPRGDLGRVERQQEFISAVARRMMNPLTWLLPWRSFGAAHAAGSALTVSDGTTVIGIGQMAFALGLISVGVGTSTTVPTEPGTYYVNGQDALKWNTSEATALFDSLD